MFLNEDEPKKTLTFTLGQNLEEMSVEELDETIGELKAEITRLETTRAEKSDHLSAAQALFSKK